MLSEGWLTWHVAPYDIELTRPRIMGVLHADQSDALSRGCAMLDEGADLLCLDTGSLPAQQQSASKKPTSQKVAGDTGGCLSSNEEAELLVPVLRALVAHGAPVVVTTSHADVAKMCVRLGAVAIEDPKGFSDPEMIEVAASTRCGCIISYRKSAAQSETPRREVTLSTLKPARKMPSKRRFTLPDQPLVMRPVMGFLADQARSLMKAGVDHGRICIDPGAGFGKQINEDIVIQRAMQNMASMGYVLMCAVSGAPFVASVAGVEDNKSCNFASTGVIISAIQAGARLIRTDNVLETAQAINAFWAAARSDIRRAFIGLGSNVGDRIGYLSKACKLINAIPLTTVVAVSKAYESEPAYGIATPVANAVAEIRTELHPLVLLDELLKVENQLDRVRDLKEAGHGPRTIDCDLLWVEGECHVGSKLTLPHPLLGQRDFVLVPMEDLMQDPLRFLKHAGVHLADADKRVGRITAELGEIEWD